MKTIIRYIRPEDVAQIDEIYKGYELEPPEMTDSTLVAVEDGKVLAIFSSRVECHVEWVCKDGLKGHRAGLRVFQAGENMIRANGVSKYEVGILRNRTTMREIAESLGFVTDGQLLYEKKLGDVVL